MWIWIFVVNFAFWTNVTQFNKIKVWLIGAFTICVMKVSCCQRFGWIWSGDLLFFSFTKNVDPDVKAYQQTQFNSFCLHFVIGCSSKSRENYARKCFWIKKKNGLKFNPELALIGLWTTGPRFSSGKQGYTTSVLDNPLYMYYWSFWGDYVDQEVVIIVLLWSLGRFTCQTIQRFNPCGQHLCNRTK